MYATLVVPKVILTTKGSFASSTFAAFFITKIFLPVVNCFYMPAKITFGTEALTAINVTFMTFLTFGYVFPGEAED